jgi:hypothetical protein
MVPLTKLATLVGDASTPTFPITPQEACQAAAQTFEQALQQPFGQVLESSLGACWVLPATCPGSGAKAAGCNLDCNDVCAEIKGDDGPFLLACDADGGLL